MKTKEVVDDITMNRAITQIIYEIIERSKDLNQVVLALRPGGFTWLIAFRSDWLSVFVRMAIIEAVLKGRQ